VSSGAFAYSLRDEIFRSGKVRWRIENKKDHSVSPETFLNIISLSYQTPSRWLTIEIPLEWKEVCAAQEFLLSVYAEPSRPLSCRAVIRLPRFSEGHADYEFARLDLSVGGRHANRAGRLALPDLVETDLAPSATSALFRCGRRPIAAHQLLELLLLLSDRLCKQ
jgi:hypothetical protein